MRKELFTVKRNLITVIIALLVMLVFALTAAVIILSNDRDGKSPQDGVITTSGDGSTRDDGTKDDGTKDGGTKDDGTRDDGTGDDSTKDGGEGDSGEPDTSSAEITAPNTDKTDAPDTSETDDAAPETNVTETIAPETEPSITETEEPKGSTPEGFEKKLTLRSETGTSLNVRAECSAVRGDSGRVKVKVELYLDHRALGVGERTVSLTVGDESVKVKTGAIDEEDNSIHELLLAAYEGEFDYGDVITVKGSYPFRGSYSGIELDSITVEGVLDLYTEQ